MEWRLPAEWHPQESVWLVWPRDPVTWPDGRIEGARDAYQKAVEAIAPQRVDLVVHPDLEAEVRVRLKDAAHVHFHPTVHQDSWIRDYGPLTALDPEGRRKMLKFRFDAWGGKYESLLADEHVVGRLVAAGALPAVEEVDFVLEGGAVETDGHGTFLATLSVAEGRGQTAPEHEDILRRHLGAKKVLWLREGIEGDDTDGHIDTLTRFVAAGKIVSATAPEGHPDHAALAHNLDRLETYTDARGRPLEILTLPSPPRQETGQGDPLPAGYANFLITDHAVLVPAYGSATDSEALETISALLPGRQAVPIPHEDLIWGFGGIHCLSMQVPRA